MDVNQLSYNGFEKEENQKIVLKNVLEYEELLRSYYKERINKFHQEAINANSSPFRFYSEEHCSVLILIVPEDFDYKTQAEFFLFSTPNVREIKAKLIDHSELQSVDKYLHDHVFIREEILPRLGYDSTQIMYHDSCEIEPFKNDTAFTKRQFSIKEVDQVHGGNLKQKLKELIRTEINSFQEINQKQNSYFAKDVAKFPFSILDLKPLLNAMDSADFSYQLDQAMAAYHQNLFLPCAATLGVCLETICLKICELHELKVKGNETQLGKLRDVLNDAKVTTRRENGRLTIAYQMRNLASHSSPGETLKEDCHFMLAVMNEMAHQHLQPI